MIDKILIRVPINVKNTLKRESERIGISVNALMIQIVGEWIQKKVNQSD